MSAGLVVALALAGGVGAVVRFVLDSILRSRLETSVPVGTMTINITGSFVLGILLGVAGSHPDLHPLYLIVGVGFLGGYTTFSTASFETVRLIQAKNFVAALLSGVGTLALALSAAVLGLWLGNWAGGLW
ncbi:fluoride efflux transporter CrcB [Arthrobacter sp. H41]|uniref:fluoride efflux transporter CrcB n=1 Tax=Arthrobacter sp. H41 TaxID=1312978 RepID=UPI00047C80D9|nr:fluoride efflux transporter CrcB [Arthrobacter sp. H41]